MGGGECIRFLCFPSIHVNSARMWKYACCMFPLKNSIIIAEFSWSSINKTWFQAFIRSRNDVTCIHITKQFMSRACELHLIKQFDMTCFPKNVFYWKYIMSFFVMHVLMILFLSCHYMRMHVMVNFVKVFDVQMSHFVYMINECWDFYDLVNILSKIL